MDVDEAIRLLQAIKEMEGGAKQVKSGAKKAATSSKKVAKKVKRAPSAYNEYMKKQLGKLKKKHPRTFRKPSRQLPILQLRISNFRIIS